MNDLIERLKSLFRRGPCDCDACTGRQSNQSRSPYVSHGLHMWIDRDGVQHFRAKSRIVEPW